jgi:hypothetical protein
MSKLSLKQTAEFAGTTKPTILKHIASGRVSGEKDETGRWWFDMAELVRAYGEPSSRTTSISIANPQDLQQELPAETVIELATLRARLAVMEEDRERERRDKDATIIDLRARLDHEADERRRLTTLLTDQRPTPPVATSRGLFGWFKGAR